MNKQTLSKLGLLFGVLLPVPPIRETGYTLAKRLVLQDNKRLLISSEIIKGEVRKRKKRRVVEQRKMEARKDRMGNLLFADNDAIIIHKELKDDHELPISAILS